jgi:hypothetical protein
VTAPFGITYFPDRSAAVSSEQTTSIEELARLISSTTAAAKERLPWLKLARFGTLPSTKGSLRWDSNVIAVTGAEGDYDGEAVSFEEAVEILDKAGIHSIVYTSPSHTPKKPRWRVLCPFSRELSPTERAPMIGRLNGLFGGIFSAESWTLSQSYYYGSVNGNSDHRAEIIDGTQFIDQCDELDEIWLGKPDTKPISNGAEQPRSGPLDERALIENIISGKAYHLSCTRLLGRWAQQGVAFMDAQRRLLGYFDDVFPPDRDARWPQRRADVPRTVRDIYGKEATKRDANEPPADFDARMPPRSADDGDDENLDLGEWDFGEDDEPIPPRGWQLGNLMCRQFLSAIFADGGVGKTALIIAMALSLATRRQLLDEHVFIRCRVLFVCFEDGKDELRRRLTAAMQDYGITKEDIKGYLFITAVSRSDAKLATMKEGVVQIGKLRGALEHSIERRGIDAMFLDPLIKAHGVSENDNAGMDFVAEQMSDIVTRYDIGLCVPQHTRKGPPDPGNADTGRGASALKDAFRLCYTLFPMSAEEASLFGIKPEERAALVRLDNAKVNLVRRSVTPRWFELVGVKIGNPNEIYPHGDEVQVIKPWYPPDHFKGVQDETWNAILDEIDAGPEDGGRYSDHSKSKRQAWPIVAKHTGKTEEQSKHIIRAWKGNKVIRLETYHDTEQRKDVLGFVVDDTKRPGPRG